MDNEKDAPKMLFLAHLLKMMNINDSMKSSIFISLFVLLCMGTSAQEYDLFLCIGQSNMAGRGYMSEEVLDTIPGVYLFNDRGQFEKAVNPLNRYSTIRKGMELQRVGPSYSFSKMIAVKTGRAVGLIVNARGGSSIQSWEKGAKNGYYEEVLHRVKAAMEYGTLKAVIWHQGESDASKPELYKKQLAKLVANLRPDLNLPDLFFVAGEIAHWNRRELSAESGKTFNEMIRHIGDFIPHAACVSSEGLSPLIDENDPHFDTNSQVILGERYAKEILKHCYSINY